MSRTRSYNTKEMNNRKIKFRAWDKDTKVMFDLVGLVFPLPNTTYEEGRNRVYMQFTGLLDKNGKEIWEGDIVKILYTDWPSCSGCHSSPQEHMNAIALTRVVVWSAQGFYVSHKVDGYAESMEPGTHGFIKVIGNVFENPELLTPKGR